MKKVFITAFVLIILIAVLLFVVGSNPNVPIVKDGESGDKQRQNKDNSSPPAPDQSEGRAGPPAPQEIPPEKLPADSEEAVAKVLAIVKQTLEEDVEIIVMSREAVEWPNACMGIENPDGVCAQVITPGYKVVVRIGNSLQTYHFNSLTGGIKFVSAEEI